MAPKTNATLKPVGSVPMLVNPPGSARHDLGVDRKGDAEHDEDEHGGNLHEDEPLERDVDDRCEASARSR